VDESIDTVDDVTQDRFVLIRIDGLHCHKCEQRVGDALRAVAGVREVEVDFASGQASVLFEGGEIDALLRAVNDAGYTATGFTAGARSGDA
jgi:copper chaperone CopZ